MADIHAVKELIVAQGEAWNSFIKRNDARIGDLEKGLADIAKKNARGMLAGAGAGEYSAEDAEYKQAFLNWARSGRELDLQTKALSSGSDPDGGFLMPKQLDTELSKVLRDLSPMRQLARVVQADTADFHMIHSVGGTGYSWVGETAARPETDSPSFQKISPPVGTIYANPGITQALLEDSNWNMEEWLLGELTEAFAEGEGDAFCNGNGVNKPRGFTTYTTASTADGVRANDQLQYIATGGAGAFASSDPADALIALVHALKPAYRMGAAWIMNSDALEEIRKMKDGSGQFYLWQPALNEGNPDKLLGYPVYTDENMPAIAANSYSVAFGNFMRGYAVVDRTTTMLRDPFTNKPYVHFYTQRRVGGAVRDFRAIKLLKFAAS